MDDPTDTLLATARVVRDDLYAGQDLLDQVLTDGAENLVLPTPLAYEMDYRLLAAQIPAEADEAWRDIAGARRRLALFLRHKEDVDLAEAANLHDVLDVARSHLGEVAGLDYRPHCDRRPLI